MAGITPRSRYSRCKSSPARVKGSRAGKQNGLDALKKLRNFCRDSSYDSSDVQLLPRRQRIIFHDLAEGSVLPIVTSYILVAHKDVQLCYVRQLGVTCLCFAVGGTGKVDNARKVTGPAGEFHR